MDYAIKDTTLTAIGDAVRSKVLGIDETPYKHSHFVLTWTSGSVTNITAVTCPWEINQIESIKVRINSITNHQENGWRVQYGSASGSNYFLDYNLELPYEFVVWGNYVNFSAYHNAPPSENANLPLPELDVEIFGVDENNNDYFYTPLEMVEAIKGINGVPKEVFDLTTAVNISNCFSTGKWQFLLKNYPEQFKLKTNNIDNAESCFKGCYGLVDLSKLKMAGTSNITNAPTNFHNAFSGCYNLKHLPTFTTKVDFVYTSNIFGNCYRLRELNFTPNFNGHFQYNAYITDKKGMFENCYSLRKIPGSLFTNSNNQSSTPGSYMSSYWFENSCSGCYALDELLDIPLPTKYTFSTNIFRYFVNRCYRAKDLTFEINEDGTPVVWKFTNQTLDLSTYGNIGTNNKTTISTAILSYNSGITADKEVKDDATYQALKNDEDWFSYSNDYARYNHDSAVRTIASLPDNSTTGINTIKFRGNAGALTDGGAINTLTEEEIAVATAKGWTIAFV